MELDTWVRDGYAILRYDRATGKGIYFRLNLELPAGYFEIGIVTGAREDSFLAGRFYPIYVTDKLKVIVPEYASYPTDNHYFTFGVEGFDIYSKYNGTEFLRLKDYRAMTPGAAALKGNTGYGVRRTVLRHKENMRLLSDYENHKLDLRDFGLREVKGQASISGGSSQLIFSVPPGFRRGDYVIVEIGGESGRGLRGTRGVGGTWPAKSYVNRSAMNADTGQPENTYAWIESDRMVSQWKSSIWTPVGTNGYYHSIVYPISLRAKIVEIASDGLTATLDKTAATGAVNAEVYLDNYYTFQRLLRTPKYDGEVNFPVFMQRANDFTAITPTGITIQLPAGNYAVGDIINWESAVGWKLIGEGQNASRLFSPQGVKSASINILSDSTKISNFELAGNARDNGFGLNVTETDVPRAGAWPSGIHFQSTENGIAEDLTVTNVFQKAVGASRTKNVWARRVKGIMTDGLRQYVQWHFQWSDSIGGGCEDCTVESPKLLGGFESFKSTGTQFVRPVGINAVMAVNSAEDFLFKDAKITIRAGSNYDNAWFSVGTPIVSVSTNVRGGSAALGGLIDNITMIQEGFVNGPGDHNQDSLIGIVVNKNNPNVTIRGGSYSAPDYHTPTAMHGAFGINSTGDNLLVDGFRVIGKADPKWGNISFTAGIVKNCVVDQIRPTGPTAIIQNCRTNAESAVSER
jgi:hypothetical protein